MREILYQGTYKNVQIHTKRTYLGYLATLNCIPCSVKRQNASTGNNLIIQQENKMNLLNMNPKLGILATMVTGAILMTSFHSIAMATSTENYDQKQMNQENMHGHIKARLDRLADRLEIKASQQAVWEDFAKSVEMLADRNVKKPNDDADAVTISRYRAERATEFANKLTKIADATAKLQSALSEDQRKILDQTAHRFLHYDQGVSHMRHGMNREGNGRGWNLHEHGAS